MSKSEEILQFWFEGLNDEVVIDNKNPTVKKWFVKDPQFDQKIRAQFEEDIQKAARGEYKSWEASASGILALILLFDQFSRNIYRGSAQAFAFDLKALTLSLETIHRQKDEELSLIQRVFVYMPLEHDESPGVQNLSVSRFKRIVELSKKKCPQNTAYFEYNHKYALRHEAIIKEFGRFPHRNVILGRKSTLQELDFLQKPNASF